MLKRSLVILIMVALFVSGGYFIVRHFRATVKADPPQLVTVKRGMFIHEILGRGSVDSAKNVEVRCRVESAGMEGLSIVTVVPEGTLVKKGDMLIELESSRLEENTEKQLVTVIGSKAKLEQAQADLKTAELTLTEYLEGTYEQQIKTIESEIFSAREQVHTQEDNLAHFNRLYERDYITYSTIEAYLIELDKAKLARGIAEQKLDVLQRLTKEKMVTQYEAAITTAKALVAAAEQTFQIDENRLEHLKRQLANCTIYAPSDGQVVYYMPRWGSDENLVREGMKVIDKQILILLPDPTQMQVKGLINEANVRYVSKGQKTAVRLEAFLNQVFDGVVSNVNPYAEQAGFMGGNNMSREYLATVRILNPPEDIKTGLTAEVRITVNEIPNALLLPRQAVFEYGKKMYAVTYNDGKWDKVEVKTGPPNDKEVVILEGLNEGDTVVLGAWAHRDKIDLPKLEPGTGPKDVNPEDEERFREQMRQEMAEGQQREGARPGGQRERPAGGGSPDGGAPPGGGGRPPGGGGPSGGGGGGPRP